PVAQDLRSNARTDRPRLEVTVRRCRFGAGLVAVQPRLECLGGPGWHAGAEVVVVVGPHRSRQSDGTSDDRPVDGVCEAAGSWCLRTILEQRADRSDAAAENVPD